jgi:hypothetical protein
LQCGDSCELGEEKVVMEKATGFNGLSQEGKDKRKNE